MTVAQLSQLTHQSEAGTTDTLQVRVNDGTLWSNWASFTVTAPTVQPPTLSVTSDPNAMRGQTLALSNLVTVSDPDNVGYTQLVLIDAQGIPTGGQFVVNGVAQAGGQEIILTPANFANTVYDVGTAGGTDTIYATLDVNGTYSGWQQLTVTAPTVQPPTLSVTSDPNATGGQAIALSNLVTILNPDNASYTQLELEDAPGTVTGGQFVVNGVAQTGGQEIDLTPANVANTVYDVGTAGGTVFLYAQLDVNGTLSGWQQLYVTASAASATGAPAATKSSIVASPGSVTANGTATTALTVTVEDANGNAVAGTTVTLSATGTGNTFTPVTGITNASGVFTATLASTVAQTETITATEGAAQESTSVTFVAGAPAATRSSIVASPGSVTANGIATTAVTVTVEDANGHTVAGTTVTLSASGSGNTLAPIRLV